MANLIYSPQAYLEFFVNPTLLELLLSQIERDSNITYYVINKRGDLRTNTYSDGPNAVTWGVFPGKEIVQPTIVEAVSFMAWKVSRFSKNHVALNMNKFPYRTRPSNWVHNGPSFMNTAHLLRNLYLSSWTHLSLSTSYTTTSMMPMLSLDLSIRQVPNTWPPSPRRLLSMVTNDLNLGHIFLHLLDSLLKLIGFNPRYLQSLPWVQ